MYFGDYRDGKVTGKGVYTWENREVYDGEWNQGLKEGHGIWKGVNNDSYIGEWFSSKAHGLLYNNISVPQNFTVRFRSMFASGFISIRNQGGNKSKISKENFKTGISNFV